MNVTIYVKQGCPYCAAAKKHYGDIGVKYKEVDVHTVPGAMDEVLKITDGQRIVPVIVEDGRVKLGFGGG
jgi:glutaredoxin 3